MSRILLVEDDAAMRDMVGYALEKEGMEVAAVADAETALGLFHAESPFDLILLDVMLPGMDGIELCRRITAESSVPVMMLTARDDETSVVVGLEVGADDYVTKPFSPRELVSRVRAHLRRQHLNSHALDEETILRFPGLELDLACQQVWVAGDLVRLTAAQFRILTLLASHPGRVYNRAQIMEPVWGVEFPGDSRAADVHVQNIRQKIEPDPKNPRYIKTVRGMGYKFAGL